MLLAFQHPVPAGSIHAEDSNVSLKDTTEFANNHADDLGGKRIRTCRDIAAIPVIITKTVYLVFTISRASTNEKHPRKQTGRYNKTPSFDWLSINTVVKHTPLGEVKDSGCKIHQPCCRRSSLPIIYCPLFFTKICFPLLDQAPVIHSGTSPETCPDGIRSCRGLWVVSWIRPSAAPRRRNVSLQSYLNTCRCRFPLDIPGTCFHSIITVYSLAPIFCRPRTIPLMFHFVKRARINI